MKTPRKAMILAAGLGTRLLPLTENKPKALVPVANQPMIARVIESLKAYGIQEILVNAHHQAEQLAGYLDKGRPFGLKIEIRIEPEILGTGGGIKNSTGFWDDESFFVVNSDILTDIPLDQAFAFHQKSHDLATLVLHDHADHSRILVDFNNCITDISPKNFPNRLAFTGIHILHPAILDYIPDNTFYHIMDTYRELLKTGKRIKAYISKNHYWYDIGSIESYKKANQALIKASPAIGHQCRIEPEVAFKGWAVIGDQCILEKKVLINNSVLWEGVRVKKGCRVLDSIVTENKIVERDLNQEIY